MNKETKALAEVYSALLGTGDSAPTDFQNATVEELQAAILEHFKPKQMEELFKEAFTRGIQYSLFQQKQANHTLSEEDFLGTNGLLHTSLDWDDVMLDWG